MSVKMTGKSGASQDCKWNSWQYKSRISIVPQVDDFKKKLSNNLAASTKRIKVTQFIAGKNPDEFKPLIGKLCDKDLVEPLHLKNNGVQHLHSMLLNLAIASSALPPKLSSLNCMPHIVQCPRI